MTTLDVPYAGGLAGWRAASAGGAVGLAARAAHVRPRLVVGRADSARQEEGGGQVGVECLGAGPPSSKTQVGPGNNIPLYY